MAEPKYSTDLTHDIDEMLTSEGLLKRRELGEASPPPGLPQPAVPGRPPPLDEGVVDPDLELDGQARAGLDYSGFPNHFAMKMDTTTGKRKDTGGDEVEKISPTQAFTAGQDFGTKKAQGDDDDDDELDPNATPVPEGLPPLFSPPRDHPASPPKRRRQKQHQHPGHPEEKEEEEKNAGGQSEHTDKMLKMQEMILAQLSAQAGQMTSMNTRLDESTSTTRGLVQAAMLKADSALEEVKRTRDELTKALEASAAAHLEQMRKMERQVEEAMNYIDTMKNEKTAAEARGADPWADFNRRAAAAPAAAAAPPAPRRLDPDDFMVIVGGFLTNTRKSVIEDKLRELTTDTRARPTDLFAPYRRGRIGMVKFATRADAMAFVLATRTLKKPSLDTEAPQPAYMWAQMSRPKEERERTKEVRKAAAILRSIIGDTLATEHDLSVDYRDLKLFYGDGALMSTTAGGQLEADERAWARLLPAFSLPDFSARVQQ